jgi:uncharacterized protein (DUF433 family)
MKNVIQTRPLLGNGIYTVPDMSTILGIPYDKIRRWINSFWNDRFGSKYGQTYSWNVDLTKAVNFYTLVEIYTFYQLSQSGVSTHELLSAHEILSNDFNTPYPFASKKVLNQIQTDGRKVLLDRDEEGIYTVDRFKQYTIGFIREFYKNLDFETDKLALRLWPLGKDKSIVCDPEYQFGQPIIAKRNLLAEVIAEMVLAGDSIKFVAKTYNLNTNQIHDAIAYVQRAA